MKHNTSYRVLADPGFERSMRALSAQAIAAPVKLPAPIKATADYSWIRKASFAIVALAILLAVSIMLVVRAEIPAAPASATVDMEETTDEAMARIHRQFIIARLQ